MGRTGHKRSLEASSGEEPRHKVFPLKCIFTLRPSENTVAGTIVRVRLEHFMCHEELDWEPNRNVNFVTGLNGSGKSSVLQGLVLGLLADSKHTKRYNKLTDFIQKGHQKAVIQVSLRNEGEDAYKPETYGGAITFQRTITDNGQSAVFIMDEKLAKVKKSTKEAREEGKRILESFRINTDNPIAILQQEEAKELLKVESPGNLYSFFQKATLLKQCIDQYSGAETELEKTRQTITQKKSHVKDLGKQVTTIFEKIQSLDRLIERDQEEMRLEDEYIWALVNQNKDQHEKIVQKIAQKENGMEVPQGKLDGLQKNKAKIEKELLKETDKLENERKKYQKEEAGLLRIRQNIDGLKEREKEIRKELKGLDQMKSTVTSDVKILKEQLGKLTSAQSNKEKMAKERAKKLEKLEKFRTKIAQDIESAGAERDELESQQDSNKREIDKNEYERKGYQTKVERLEAELKEMKGMGEAKLAVYDRQAPRVADEIKEATRRNLFRTPPIGPVGSFVKLGPEASSNPKLATLLETEIGSNQIKAYLCDNDKDRTVLWEILGRVYGQQKKPQIFTSKFLPKRHLVRRVEGQRTVMDYIDIIGSPTEATVIFNHLVDQKSIESVVVCKDQAEAKKIATYVEVVPRNMNYAITQDCYRFFPPTKSTSYRSYYLDPTRSKMLGANMSNKVDEKEEEVKKARSIISDINAKTDQLKRTEADIRMKNENIKSKISGMRQELQKTSSEKSQLKAEEEGLDNFEALKTQMMKKQSELDTILEDHKATVSERDQIGTQIKEKSKLLNEKTKEISELRASSNPIEREISKIEGLISSKKKEITNLEKVVKGYQKAIADAKKEMKDNEADGKKYKKAALERTNGKVLNPTSTVIQLNAKIKQLRELKKKQGSGEAQKEKEIILEEYRKKKEQYLTQKTKVGSLEEMVKDMEKMNERRSANYLFIRKTISNIISRRFALESEIFSSQYGNTISIDINHQRRELNFIFRTPEGDHVGTDIQSLSGGEKSYAQMCLIASLWENMNPPFRALDEWDVFLDNINRKQISRTLLGFGLQKQDYQFIFISPQGAADVDVNPSDRSKVTITEIKKTK